MIKKTKNTHTHTAETNDVTMKMNDTIQENNSENTGPTFSWDFFQAL